MDPYEVGGLSGTVFVAVASSPKGFLVEGEQEDGRWLPGWKTAR